jgi:hypothetical protein
MNSGGNNVTTAQELLYLPLVNNAISVIRSEGAGRISRAGGTTSGVTSGTVTAGSARNEHLDIDSPENAKPLLPIEVYENLGIKPVRRFGLNILLIIASAVVFVAVLAWFETLRSFYDRTWEIDPNRDRFQPSIERLGYAVLVTMVAILVVWAFYHVIQDEHTDEEISLM